VDSILAQTYSNLEIILVDDGSPDRCGELCDEYAEKDGRIRVIHKKNGGLSDARNAGIDVAAGKYLAFVDSDDYIHPKMYEYLYSAIVQTKANVAVCNFKEVGEEENTEHSVLDAKKVKGYASVEYLELYSASYRYLTSVVAWNKLYASTLFGDMRYPKGLVHEDEYVTYKLVYAAKRVAVVEAPLYYYVQRGNSIMDTTNAGTDLTRITALNEKLAFWKEHGEFVLMGKTLRTYQNLLPRLVSKKKKGVLTARQIKDVLQPGEKVVTASRGQLKWMQYFKFRFMFGMPEFFYDLHEFYLKLKPGCSSYRQE
jgi:glycosyltransferase involved in cell wall biosynthesis